jgi:hypothetical protein
MLLELLTIVKPKIRTKEKGRIKHKKRQTNPAHLKSLRHTPHQGICDHAQRLHEVLTESLDELSVLHFVLVIEGEEGLGAGVRCVPELEG